MASVIPRVAVTEPKYRYWWANGWWGNQGHLPHCVGFSWLHWIEDGPITHSATRTAGTGPLMDPSELYREAQKVDQWPGESYDGTSVRAGAKILMSRGLVGGYRWAWDAGTVVRALLTTGPVVVGTWWYSEMFVPKPDKESGKLLIRAQGSKAGGHAYLINGVNTEKGLVRVKNSWGQEWGSNGHAYMPIEDLDKLVKDQGEACLAIEVQT
jgi:hypothetical protein